MFWPMAQQYRHVVPLNSDRLPANHNLFDLWSRSKAKCEVLWAILNSTPVALSKHQFGRSAGVEGNLKTEVVDVNMMLVPDIRQASPEAADRAVAACEKIGRRLTSRYLYEEFRLDDRRELDDAVLEMLGVEDAGDRADLRDRLYKAMSEMYGAIRDREVIAQRDRRRASRKATRTALDITDEIWFENQSDLNFLQFPEDFVERPNDGDIFDLPDGRVEVGTALMEIEGLLRTGTIRVGGRDGEVLDTGTVSRARFLEALSLCHRSGQVRVPDDETCDHAVSGFDRYRQELSGRCTELAEHRTRDQRLRNAIVNALMRRALQWRRS